MPFRQFIQAHVRCDHQRYISRTQCQCQSDKSTRYTFQDASDKLRSILTILGLFEKAHHLLGCYLTIDLLPSFSITLIVRRFEPI